MLPQGISTELLFNPLVEETPLASPFLAKVLPSKIDALDQEIFLDSLPRFQLHLTV